MKPDTPNFIQAWVKDLKDEVDDNWLRIFPIWIISFLFCGGIVGYYLPDSFWSRDRDTATIVYTGILTFNGILLALSWSAFAKIYDMIGAGRFSAFLHDNGVLDSYLFLVRYVHASQMAAMVASIVTLLLVQFPDVALEWQRAACVVTLGLSAYGIKEASLAVGVMQDLVRYKAIYDAEGRSNLRAV